VGSALGLSRPRAQQLYHAAVTHARQVAQKAALL
jgi:hypothetical protein